MNDYPDISKLCTDCFQSTLQVSTDDNGMPCLRCSECDTVWYDQDRANVALLAAKIARLEKQLNDPLEGLEAYKRNAEQSALNTRWLIGIIDQMHEILCPESTGTWQQRAEQCLRVVRRSREAETVKETSD